MRRLDSSSTALWELHISQIKLAIESEVIDSTKPVIVKNKNKWYIPTVKYRCSIRLNSKGQT